MTVVDASEPAGELPATLVWNPSVDRSPAVTCRSTTFVNVAGSMPVMFVLLSSLPAIPKRMAAAACTSGNWFSAADSVGLTPPRPNPPEVIVTSPVKACPI